MKETERCVSDWYEVSRKRDVGRIVSQCHHISKRIVSFFITANAT
jgi:hypothetical protein